MGLRLGVVFQAEIAQFQPFVHPSFAMLGFQHFDGGQGIFVRGSDKGHGKGAKRQVVQTPPLFGHIVVMPFRYCAGNDVDLPPVQAHAVVQGGGVFVTRFQIWQKYLALCDL